MFRIIIPIAAFIYTVALVTVSLIGLNDLPDFGISFLDLIFHFLSYSLLTVLWFYSFFWLFKLIVKRAIFFAAIFAVILGIIIEVLQETLTLTRTMDVFDVLANTLGVLLTSMALSYKNGLHVKNI